MANAFTPRPAPFGAVTVHRMISTVETVFAGILAWRKAAQTDAALRKLTDRELADLGLDRGWLEDFSGDFAARRA